MTQELEIFVQTQGKGLYMVSGSVLEEIGDNLPQSGLLNLFIPHTSASLVLQENADPTAKKDLEKFISRLVPDAESWHQHTLEGADDTTSHMKSSITTTSLTIPIRRGRLALGTWQGIYLWEHRDRPHRRHLLITIYS